MLLQVLDSNVTELALQLVLVLLGVGKALVDAILVKGCGRLQLGRKEEGGVLSAGTVLAAFIPTTVLQYPSL